MVVRNVPTLLPRADKWKLIASSRIENYRKTYITTDQFLPVMRTPLLLVNAIFYMFLGALVVVNVLDFAVDQDREANLLYNIEIFTLAIINCVIAFVFAVYGLRLLYRQQVQSDDSSESRRELLAVRSDEKRKGGALRRKGRG